MTKINLTEIWRFRSRQLSDALGRLGEARIGLGGQSLGMGY
jgi:hypothetical protein